MTSSPRDPRKAERFARACRKEATDATPVWFMRQAGRFLPAYRKVRERYGIVEICKTPELAAAVTLLPLDLLDVDAAILFADISLPFEGLGVRFALEEGEGPVLDAPLRDESAVGALRAFEAQRDVPWLLETVRIVRRELSGRVPLIGFSAAPFTLASYLVEGRGSRDWRFTRRFMFSRPDLWRALSNHLADTVIEYLRAQVAAGVEAVQVFDSWVGCLSPQDYQEFVAPHSKRVFEALAALRVPAIHFGTGTASLLERMAAAGGDVIGLDWRVPLDEGWRRVGPERAIQGNLDPAVLLADFEFVRERAADVLARAGGRPGHVFNLGHGVLPGTEPDTVRRLVDFVHEATSTNGP